MSFLDFYNTDKMSFSHQLLLHFVPRKVASVIRFGGRYRDYCNILVFNELMKDYVEPAKDNWIQKEETGRIKTTWLGNFIGLVSFFVPY